MAEPTIGTGFGLIRYLLQFDPDKDYTYFKSPDGQDCLRKTYYVTKWSAFAGMVCGTWDVIYRTSPVGYSQYAYRFGYWLFPFVSMAATYTSITCMATQFRKKDDIYNHGLGGLASGFVWGSIRNSVNGGVKVGLFLAFIGMMTKLDNIENFGMYKLKSYRMEGNIRTPHTDMTLYREPPTAKEDARRVPTYNYD